MIPVPFSCQISHCKSGIIPIFPSGKINHSLLINAKHNNYLDYHLIIVYIICIFKGGISNRALNKFKKFVKNFRFRKTLMIINI
jgi:hypothetical protein